MGDLVSRLEIDIFWSSSATVAGEPVWYGNHCSKIQGQRQGIQEGQDEQSLKERKKSRQTVSRQSWRLLSPSSRCMCRGLKVQLFIDFLWCQSHPKPMFPFEASNACFSKFDHDDSMTFWLNKLWFTLRLIGTVCAWPDWGVAAAFLPIQYPTEHLDLEQILFLRAKLPQWSSRNTIHQGPIWLNSAIKFSHLSMGEL